MRRLAASVTALADCFALYNQKMPLLQIHYSKNLDATVRAEALVGALHRAALATGEVAQAALRTFARPYDTYAIGDENPDNAFIHIILRMRKRDPEAQRAIGDAVFAALTEFMEAEYQRRPLSLSLEIIDIDTWRRNNMHAK